MNVPIAPMPHADPFKSTLVDGRPDQPIDPRPLGVESFGASHVGRVRTSNQDQFLVAALTQAMRIEQSSLEQSQVRFAGDQGHLFVVADGMGGHQGGEQASALALATIEEFLLDTLRWIFALKSPGNDVLQDFHAALRRADAVVCEKASRHPELQGMGTTLTMAYSMGSELFVAHVGDSRCYLARHGAIHQVTRDHTVVAQMVERGMMPPASAAKHPLAHVITNAVGGDQPGVHVDLHRVRLEPGDLVVLCSDGLTGMIPDERILCTVAGEIDPRTACERLIQLALEAGGVDNVTAIVARYALPPPPRPTAEA